MGLSYTEFKELVRQREFNNFSSLNMIVNNLKEFYNEEEFKFFYPKNIYNDKETELIVFLSAGYIKIKLDSDKNFVFEHCYSKVISKTLKASRYISGNHELRVMFDNGQELVFNNLEDSNSNWEDSYSESIRELYKVI